MSSPVQHMYELRICLILLDKFTLAAFSGFLDALRLAADDGAKSRQIRVAWSVIGLNSTVVTSSCGISVNTQSSIGNIEDYDYLAICGGNSYANSSSPLKLTQLIQQAHKNSVGLLGICTGSFAIAHAGFTDDRCFCIHWNVVGAFKELNPKARLTSDKIFIDEGDVITCAGSTAAIDLALYLISRHCGNDRAQQVMRHMMLTTMRPSTVPQAHFYEIPNSKCDPRVKKALHFMEQQLDQPPNMKAIARYCGLSLRQLERLFKQETGRTPIQGYQNMRLSYAKFLLINSTQNMMEIAHTAGFSDAAHFSREFKKVYSQTPRIYRINNEV